MIRYFLIVTTFLSISCSSDIIPQPAILHQTYDTFTIDKKTRLIISERKCEKVASYLKSQLKKNNLLSGDIKVEEIENPDNAIYLKLSDNTGLNLGEEGYQMDVGHHKIEISAATPKGLFWGVQSLIQLFPVEFFNKENQLKEMEIPGLHIEDKPRFSYRGMHLDVSRHFFTVNFIKKYIDLLALYKFNTFHWHLTDDQGWRIEIKRYPKLTEVGAFRDSTIIGHGSNKPQKWDGKRYGGYYTQDQIKEIVKYASEKNINIIPEIEMPGHSLAALASYPELSCTSGPFRPATSWGVFDDVYCPKIETFEFLKNVLTEVMELFPGEYIHIGGDECPKVRWENCDYCQQLMKKKGLKNENELQSYFIKQIEIFLNSHDRKLIGWDEILEGGLSPNATVMSWRGTEGGIAAAKQGHDAIMTPGDYCYFDHYQDDPSSQPLAIGGLTTLKKVYSYNPLPDVLTDEEAEHILGTQANVWTEYITTPEQVEYMILPRMAALAEVNWTAPALKNWDDFKKRIKNHFKIYDQKNLKYYSVIRE